jgi:hypothetical protein
MLASPDQQISLTDPDSRSMATSGRGPGVVGCSVQVEVETENHLIITHEVTTSGSDRSQLARVGHAIKALLVSRALLVKIKRDLENQVRGLLKNLGLVIGRAKMNAFAVRAAELTEDRPELAAVVEPLLKAREAVERQISDLDRKVMRLARNDAQVRRS